MEMATTATSGDLQRQCANLTNRAQRIPIFVKIVDLNQEVYEGRSCLVDELLRFLLIHSFTHPLSHSQES